MADHSGNEAGQSRADAADYVAELTSELAKVARRHRLDTLGYLLDMARMEAESVARRPKAAGAKPSEVHG